MESCDPHSRITQAKSCDMTYREYCELRWTRVNSIPYMLHSRKTLASEHYFLHFSTPAPACVCKQCIKHISCYDITGRVQDAFTELQPPFTFVGVGLTVDTYAQRCNHSKLFSLVAVGSSLCSCKSNLQLQLDEMRGKIRHNWAQTQGLHPIAESQPPSHRDQSSDHLLPLVHQQQMGCTLRERERIISADLIAQWLKLRDWSVDLSNEPGCQSQLRIRQALYMYVYSRSKITSLIVSMYAVMAEEECLVSSTR